MILFEGCFFFFIICLFVLVHSLNLLDTFPASTPYLALPRTAEHQPSARPAAPVPMVTLPRLSKGPAPGGGLTAADGSEDGGGRF